MNTVSNKRTSPAERMNTRLVFTMRPPSADRNGPRKRIRPDQAGNPARHAAFADVLELRWWQPVAALWFVRILVWHTNGPPESAQMQGGDRRRRRFFVAWIRNSTGSPSNCCGIVTSGGSREPCGLPSAGVFKHVCAKLTPQRIVALRAFVRRVLWELPRGQYFCLVFADGNDHAATSGSVGAESDVFAGLCFCAVAAVIGLVGLRGSGGRDHLRPALAGSGRRCVCPWRCVVATLGRRSREWRTRWRRVAVQTQSGSGCQGQPRRDGPPDLGY